MVGYSKLGFAPIGLIYLDVRSCIVETRVQGSLSLTDVLFVAFTAGDEINQPSFFVFVFVFFYSGCGS